MHFLLSKADFGSEFASIWEPPWEGRGVSALVVGGGGGIGLRNGSETAPALGVGKIAYGMVLLVFLQ